MVPDETKLRTDPPPLSEDLWALLIGGVLIALVVINALVGSPFTISTPSYSWANGNEFVQKVIAWPNVYKMGMVSLLFFVLAFKAQHRLKLILTVTGFGILCLLAVSSLLLAGNKTISGWGIEYVVFALMIGLCIRNFNLAPSWLYTVARSELYIKTGLVILGTSVLFTDIIKAGIPGILQAIVVVLVVWFTSMWISKKLKVDEEFAVIIASAVSICGVSAAIVASGAIQGDKKKLSYVTTLVLLVALPMLIIQPWIIKWLHIPELIGGAWLGGTLDTTASVTAASQLVGPIATKAGVIVKFSQNVLIGFAAIFIASWWAIRNKTVEQEKENKWKIIWDRFPKFVLGFIAASLFFSFVLPGDTTRQISSTLNGLRTVWFALAFVCIGLEANFKDLITHQGTRPAYSFVLAQLFNIVWTLLWAYILFGGYVMEVPRLE